VQRVVELHRGSIGLGDSPLGGLEVCVRLPRRPDAECPSTAPRLS
jgi:two-component system sensor histidine kinase QseC